MTLDPDSQPKEPLLWAGNQSAHAMIGFGLALIVGPWLAVAVYFIAWEYAVQIRRQGSGWKDSIADTLFVAVGALLAAFPEFALHIYAGFVLMVLIGVRAR